MSLWEEPLGDLASLDSLSVAQGNAPTSVFLFPVFLCSCSGLWVSRGDTTGQLLVTFGALFLSPSWTYQEFYLAPACTL